MNQGKKKGPQFDVKDVNDTIHFTEVHKELGASILIDKEMDA